jgi:hypothetical protein
MRGVRSCGSLPSSRERPAVATMVANRASDTARTPGSDAANRLGGTRFSRQPAKTRSLTRTTCNAWKPKCLQAGNANEPGGDAPACWPGANSGSPHKIETGTHDSEARYRTAEARVGQPDRIAANVVAANTIWIEDSIHPTMFNPGPLWVNADIGRSVSATGRCLSHLAVAPQTASVQLSEKANADVEKGRPSRSRCQDRPLASMPLRTRRVPSAGIKTVHTP